MFLSVKEHVSLWRKTTIKTRIIYTFLYIKSRYNIDILYYSFFVCNKNFPTFVSKKN